MTDTPINQTMGAREWAMLLALSLLWGGSFLFVGIAVSELPPLTIVVLRVSIAALALWLLVRLTGVAMPMDRRAWTAFFGMGLLNNAIPFCLIVWGQTHVASGLASILNAPTPLFTVVVAHFLTRDEKMTAPRLLGVVIGFAGVAVMIGGAALQSLGMHVVAQLAIVAAALAYGFGGVYGRRFRTLGIAPMATATGQVTASTLMLLPVMLVVDAPWMLAVPSARTIAAILGLALLSTVVAYILFFRILATAGATNLSLVTLLIPVSAVLLGALVLGETLEPKHFAGMALIGAGLAAIDGRPLRWLGRFATRGTGGPR